MTTEPCTQSPPPTSTRARILDWLIAEHGQALRHQAFRHAPDPEGAEDALQDACVQFLRAYEGPPGLEALRWMQTTTKRCAWAIGRRQRRHPQRHLTTTDVFVEGEAYPTIDEGPGPAELASRREEHALIRADFEQLKPDERTALIMLALGCSYREIGERRGWTYTKVNRCIAEGRAALRPSRIRHS